MGLESLLEAAKIVEKREVNLDKHHPPHPLLGSANTEKLEHRRTQIYRKSHNQLEKNRRRHLRECLHGLRELLPATSDTPKVTTLNVLQSARRYIKLLQHEDSRAQMIKHSLCEEQRRLRAELGHLMNLSPPRRGGLHEYVYRSRGTLSSESSCEDEYVDVVNDDDDVRERGGYESSADETSSISSALSCGSTF